MMPPCLENDTIYQLLLTHFYSGTLNFSLVPSDVEKITWEWQEKFLDATLNNELLKKYPVSNKFVILFLKKLISILEMGQEVHNDFYSHLCVAMRHASEEDSFSCRHYVLWNDLSKIITIKETRSMVVDGTTGLRTWEAAIMLTDWALCNKKLFENKKVLELGSGVGFAGIAIGKYCDTSSVVLTDFHEEVLKTACENIEINFPHLIRSHLSEATYFKNKTESVTMGAYTLDWNNNDDIPKNESPDILIGADIVYDPSILEPLCNVIKVFCTRNENLQVYISSVIRNDDTYKLFLRTLQLMNFQYEKIDIKSVHIKWDENVKRSLLKIKYNH